MAFAQLTYRESLRDIEVCLRGNRSKLYHMGIRSRVAKSTLADANETRDWRIYADFAQVLITRARALYAKDDFGVEPFIVKAADWKGQADATYSWGGAVSGPLIFKETIALGPGYDHSAVPGRQPLIVERQDGGTFIERWTKVLQLAPERRPWMVHVETWNEWHEGTDVAQSRE